MLVMIKFQYLLWITSLVKSYIRLLGVKEWASRSELSTSDRLEHNNLPTPTQFEVKAAPLKKVAIPHERKWKMFAFVQESNLSSYVYLCD